MAGLRWPRKPPPKSHYQSSPSSMKYQSKHLPKPRGRWGSPRISYGAVGIVLRDGPDLAFKSVGDNSRCRSDARCLTHTWANLGQRSPRLELKMSMERKGKACLLAAGAFSTRRSVSAPTLFLSVTLAGWAACSGRTGVIVDADGDVAMTLEVAATTMPDGVNGALLPVS